MLAPTHPLSPNRLRRFLIRALVALAIIVALLTAFSIIAVDIITTGQHSTINRADANNVGANWREVSFSSRSENLTLKGWLFTAPQPSGRSVVFVPSWTATRINGQYGGLAHDLLAHGYDVLMFDGRASGESDGDHFTFGNKEQNDVLGAYDFMRTQGYNPHQMTFFGLSMGGAAVLLASPQIPDVAALVTDSAFAELRPILDRQASNYSHLPAFLAGPLMLAAPLFGVNPDLRPVDAVNAQPNRAFLFFHGASDSLVPVAQAHELRAASTNSASDLIIVPGAEHTAAYPTNPAAYEARLYQFLDHEMGAQ